MIRMLGHLILSWRSLRLSSFLLIHFSFFLSDSFISTILSFTSLILSSALVILLFVASSVFYFIYCIIHYYWLFFVSSRKRKRKVKSLSRVQLFVTPWTVAHQAPLSMGFSRQEYWSGLQFPSPGDLPNPGIEPGSPVLQTDSLPPEPPGKPQRKSEVRAKYHGSTKDRTNPSGWVTLERLPRKCAWNWQKSHRKKNLNKGRGRKRARCTQKRAGELVQLKYKGWWLGMRRAEELAGRADRWEQDALPRRCQPQKHRCWYRSRMEWGATYFHWAPFFPFKLLRRLRGGAMNSRLPWWLRR